MKNKVIIITCMIILLSSVVSAGVLDDAIVNISFNEGSGSNAEDIVYGFNATLSGTATWGGSDLCLVGNCLYKTGGGNTLVLANSSYGADWDIISQVQNKSFSIWVKANESSPAGSDNYYGFGCARSNCFDFVRLHDRRADNKLIYRLQSNGAMDTGDIVVSVNTTDNQWHHVLVVHNISQGKFGASVYVDGVFQASAASAVNGNGVYAADSNFGFQADGGNSQQFALIDEFQIWNMSLSESQAFDVYTSYVNLSMSLVNDSVIYENEETQYSFNITFNVPVFNVTANLVFNNSDKGLTDHYRVGNTFVFEANATPEVYPDYQSPQNMISFWNYTISGSDTNGVHVNITQTLSYNVNVSECGGDNNDVIYSFILKDEQTTLNETGNLNIEVTLNYYNNSGVASFFDYATNFSGANQYDICVTPSYKNLTSDVTALFWNEESAIKTYYFVNNSAVNTTSTTDLYLLYENDSSNVYFHITDSYNIPFKDKVYVYVYRKYVDEGLSRVVEISKADYDGEALLHLVPYDVIYNFILMQNGEAIYGTSEAVITRSDYYFKPNVDDTWLTEYNEIKGFRYGLTFTNETDECTITWVDAQNAANKGVCLSGRYTRGGTTQVVADTCLVASSGSLTIDINTSRTGEYSCVAYMKGHNDFIDAVTILSKPGFRVFGEYGLMGGFFLTGTLALLNLVNPVVMIIFTVLGVGISISMKMWAASSVGLGVLMLIAIVLIIKNRY
jgi:hypothetical protein